MPTLKAPLFFFVMLFFLACSPITGHAQFRDRVVVFMDALMQRDYEKCLEQMAFVDQLEDSSYKDSIQIRLDIFRSSVERNFGGGFRYSSLNAKKKWSSVEGESTPQNAVLVSAEFYNDSVVGALEALMHEESTKIIKIRTLNKKAHKPNMVSFWIMGIFPAFVLAFNIYMIRQIKRSSFAKKWPKYLAIIMLNFPSFTYSAIDGLDFHVLNIQMLFGVGFSFSGFFGSKWSFAVPFAAIYWWRKLRKHEEQPDEEVSSPDDYNHGLEGASDIDPLPS